MTNNRTRDLTVGSPMRLILSFMLPMTFELLFQQLYSMVDTMVVGKLLGMEALAGVDSGMPAESGEKPLQRHHGDRHRLCRDDAVGCDAGVSGRAKCFPKCL